MIIETEQDATQLSEYQQSAELDWAKMKITKNKVNLLIIFNEGFVLFFCWLALEQWQCINHQIYEVSENAPANLIFSDRISIWLYGSPGRYYYIFQIFITIVNFSVSDWFYFHDFVWLAECLNISSDLAGDGGDSWHDFLKYWLAIFYCLR